MDSRSLIVLLVLICGISFGQTKSVLKTPATDRITETLVFGTGKTLRVETGATIDITGANKVGFPTGTGTVTNFVFTDSTGIDGTVTNSTTTPTLALSLTKSAVGLSNVENTALSTWAGSANITALGTVTSGSIPNTIITGLGTLSTQNGTITDYLTTANAATTYVSLSGSYANPTWITSIAWSKITSAPSFLTSNQTITLSGDVTGSGSTAITTTIANDAVTNQKLANMAPNTLKGKLSGVAGDPEDITFSGIVTESTPASGDYLIGWESGGGIRKFDIGSLPGGSPSFLILTDTPSSYSGQGNKYVRVNALETGLEFTNATGGVNDGDTLTLGLTVNRADTLPSFTVQKSGLAVDERTLWLLGADDNDDPMIQITDGSGLGTFSVTSIGNIGGRSANLTTSITVPEITYNKDGIGTTPEWGIYLRNNANAADGAQQWSPAIRWHGRGWKTDATAASRVVNFRAFVETVQGTSNPSGIWRLQSAINGIAEINYSDKFSVNSNGNVIANGNISASNLSGTNTGDVTLAGTPDYITISGQTITRNAIDLATDVTGTLPIANGGTGQTTSVAAFDALAPTTTKGDLIVHNGTDNVRVPVGTDGHSLVADSTQASGVKWAAGAGGGKVAQVVVATTNTPATTTATIPADNTIPQNTEGAEFITATITPTNASSKLIIEFDAWGSSGELNTVALALFKDSAADAIQVSAQTIGVGNYLFQFRLKWVLDAGSTSAATYRLRFGPTVTGTAAMLRQVVSSGFWSTSDNAVFTITEILP